LKTKEGVLKTTRYLPENKQNDPLENGTTHWQVVDVKFHLRMHSPK
jgi:hypothetical protein